MNPDIKALATALEAKPLILLQVSPRGATIADLVRMGVLLID